MESDDFADRHVASLDSEPNVLPNRGLGIDNGAFVLPDDFDEPMPAWFMRYFR